MTASQNCLRSVCEEVQYSFMECITGAQSLGLKFVDQFKGEDCIECGAEIRKQHSDVGVVIFKVCKDRVEGS